MISICDMTQGREVGVISHDKRDSGVGSILCFSLPMLWIFHGKFVLGHQRILRAIFH